MMGLSKGEKHFIQGGIAQDLRADGRKRLTYRPICVETGIIPQAELGRPTSLQPDKGKVAIYVDCITQQHHQCLRIFPITYYDELSAELSVSLQQCLLGAKSGAEGKLCWDLYIDSLVVDSSDGTLLDALGAAIMVHFHHFFSCFRLVQFSLGKDKELMRFLRHLSKSSPIVYSHFAHS